MPSTMPSGWIQAIREPEVIYYRTADLSVQTRAGERIGDLLLAAKGARKSTAKITYPTSRWRIENRLQRQSAFFRHLMPAPQPWRLTLLRRLRCALSWSSE